MKSKTVVLGLILVLLSVYLSGCIAENDGLAGTYTCVNDDDVLDLYDDSQWELSGSAHTWGNYTVRNGEVRLKHVFGIFIPLTIDGRDLIDPDGDRWVRD